MSRKCGVVASAVIHVKHQRHIQDLGLQLGILAVLPEHHQNILRSRKRRVRRIDEQVLAPAVIVRVESIHHQHRELADQIQALAQHVRNRGVVRLVIVGIQLQDASGNVIHHILAGRLHNDIPEKIGRQHPALCQHHLKILQLLCVRKLSEQEQVCGLLEARMLGIQESFYNVLDIISAVVEAPCARHFFPVDNLLGTDIGYISQACKHTLSIQIT